MKSHGYLSDYMVGDSNDAKSLLVAKIRLVIIRI